MTELALYGTDLFGETIKPKASGPVLVSELLKSGYVRVGVK